MLRLKDTNNIPFSIYFHYPDENTSECKVEIEVEPGVFQPYLSTQVKKYYKDKSTRKKGRYAAFEKAAQKLTTEKSVREQLWHAFLHPAESKGMVIENLEVK